MKSFRFVSAWICFAGWCLAAAPALGQQPIPGHTTSTSTGASSTNAVTIDLATLDRLHAPLLRQDLQLLGAQSCAAAGCHGGPHPGVAQPWNARGSEYPLWYENDPHARSWRTLSSAASVAMMQRLKIMDGNKIIDQQGFDNCLACHNTTKRYTEPRSQVARQEGVGCAGCHGPEQLWNGNHFQDGFDPLNSTEQGFVANGDLLTRARACAACHVGDKDRDMNHDIIAAGHPALRYEFATYHAWQPKHWRDAEANDRTAYEAQLWLAGQIAAADATLALLETRASDAHSISQWPELASHDCSACHHALGLQNVRRTPAPNALSAVAPLSQWNLAGLEWVLQYRAEQGESEDADELLRSSLRRVREVMESGPIPDRQLARQAASEARLALAAWATSGSMQWERNQFRSDRLGRLAASAAGKNSSFDTWESAAQLYLAIVAARESWPGGTSGPLHDAAETLRRGLAYPASVTSPEFAQRTRKGPPATRAEVRQMTLELAGWLGPVNVDLQPPLEEQDVAPEQSQQQIEQVLKQIAERWKNEPAPAKPPVVPPTSQPTPRRQTVPTPRAEPAPNLSKPVQPEPAQPMPTEPPRQDPERALEDLRKQLEALQGDGADE